MVIMENKYQEDAEIEAQIHNEQKFIEKPKLRAIIVNEYNQILQELELVGNMMYSNRDAVDGLSNEIALLKQEVSSLREIIQKDRSKQIKNQSRENAKKLRKMFNLAESTSLVSDPKSKLQGLLGEYNKESDSLEILHDVRENEDE